MKKIMFNDRFGLTEAVLSGRKTQTRRIYKDPVNAYGGFEIDGNTIIEYDANGNPIVTSPRYKVGEVVAVAQSYKDCGNFPDYQLDEDGYPIMPKNSGYFNKMFVRADLMTNHIRITGVRIERLHDKNGREIYEGDIVNIHDSHETCGVIEYRNRTAAFVLCRDKVKNRHKGDGIDYQLYAGRQKRYEIIGNIHDNPELLE